MSTLTNPLQEKIMRDALEDHKGTVSIGGRTITNLRFADDIDGLAGEEEKLAKLVERLDKASTAYGTEISAEKTRQTEEDVGRKHQGTDRPGVRQVPEGSGEQGEWRKLGAKSSVVPQRPSRLSE